MQTTTPAPAANPSRPVAGLAVRFTRSWQSYFPGDVATFPPRMAAGLVSRRFAQPVHISFDKPPPGAPLAMRGPGRHTMKSGERWEDPEGIEF